MIQQSIYMWGWPLPRLTKFIILLHGSVRCKETTGVSEGC